MPAAQNSSKTRLAVALDFPSPQAARSFVLPLKGKPLIFKVGLELFVAGGRELIPEFIDKGFSVFLDLKLHDIPNTVAQAVKQAEAMGVEFCTLHLGGGRAMLDAAAAARSRMTLLGVSVLTSFSTEGWAEVSEAAAGSSKSIENAVLSLVKLGAGCGIDGIVCSAWELEAVGAQNPGLFTMVPGIRPAGESHNDQTRVVTPADAKARGAHAIVVGRPITQAKDPVAVIDRILADIG